MLFFYHVRPTNFRQTVEGAAAPAPKRPAVQMPDEYLPPNKILFLQNLPESVTKDQLMALFSQYVSLLIYEILDLSDVFVQIPEPERSPYDTDEEGHCFRGIYGRGQRDCGERCVTQLQTGWGEQDQSEMHFPHTRINAKIFFPCRLLSQENNVSYSILLSCVVLLYALCILRAIYPFHRKHHGNQADLVTVVPARMQLPPLHPMNSGTRRV